MKLRIHILITCTLALYTFIAKGQQNVQFSQYHFNCLTINPAYTGYKEDLYLNAVYRKQYVTFPGSPSTGYISMDGLLNKDNKSVGIGGHLTFDKLGPQQTTSLFGTYSYRMRLNAEDTKRLCIGLAFGFNQYSLDGSALQAVDANDPEIPAGKQSTIKPDAQVGLYYFSSNFYASLSFLNLFSLYNNGAIYLNNTNVSSSEDISTHAYLSVGGLVTMSDNVKLKPSIMLKEDFHGPSSLDLNVLALLSEKLWVGASYRTAITLWQKKAVASDLNKSGAMSLMAELFATDKLRIGYSYDFITSGLSGYQSGSHEISVGLLFPNETNADRIKSPRYF